MTFDQPKRPGMCLACGEPVRVVVSEYPADHPLAGYATRLGPFLDTMSECEFLLSDGATTHITFCVTCAPQIGPEHFGTIWRCVLDCEEVYARAARVSENSRKLRLASLMRLFIVALLFRRRKGEGVERVIDRRAAA